MSALPSAPGARHPGATSPLAALDYSILQQCMHCGLCLPTCPTYAETGLERNSPRGRIALMRAVADGELETTPVFAEEMSYCLGCLACTTACPAGVDYTTLLETARAHVEASHVTATPTRSFVRWFTMRWLFTSPRTLRAAGRLLWLYQVSGLQQLARKLRLTALLPRRIRELEPATPRILRHFSDELIAEIEPPLHERRYRVALLTGCVQDLVFSDVNRSTVDVLIENGCEVVTPRNQGCCGSLHAHNGDPATARLLARRQLDTIDPGAFDAIITNAGGCGSHLKHYDRLLADDPAYAERARLWSQKIRDISEWLVAIGFRAPSAPATRSSPASPGPTATHRAPAESERMPPAAFPDRSPAATTVTYHEACHLCHGQKITSQPRALLRALPGVQFRECADSTWCCGSAGIYNITQPDTAAWLQQRKVTHLHATGASTVATANPGCHLQIENGFRLAGDATTRVVHPVVLLAEAYRREKP